MEEVKLSPFGDDVVLYVGGPDYSAKTTTTESRELRHEINTDPTDIRGKQRCLFPLWLFNPV